MLFSILPETKKPQKFEDGTFKCSVPFFSEFRQHLDCNLETECAGREDESHCRYKSDACGPDLIFAGASCYSYVTVNRDINWYDALGLCKERGQRLASLNTPEEWENVTRVLKQGKLSTSVYMGLHTSQVPLAAVPALYREVWQWDDATMAYYIDMKSDVTLSVPSCTYYLPEKKGKALDATSCLSLAASHVMCEPVHNQDETYDRMPPELHNLTAPLSWSTYLAPAHCPNGHVTYDFLSCDPGTDCGQTEHMTSCVTHEAGEMPQFDCERTFQTLHYTFVCDHREDCSDGSDEAFCVHHECPAEQCSNGQCASKAQWCDGMADCVDTTDEDCHPSVTSTRPSLLPPARVDLDGYGRYTQTTVSATDPCPVTHFRCPTSGYCLPVYLRCNGVDDCPGREDESECDSYTCPGFYRCLDSTVCLHAVHVCDGVFQCPQQDDELLCDHECPEGCRCQGLAFVCGKNLSAASYPELRYLDASGSGMVPDDLMNNFYLVRLRLSACGIVTLSNMTLPNLRELDLSGNMLEIVHMATFMGLHNLRVLILSDNPLTIVYRAGKDQTLPHIHSIDLSGAEIKVHKSDMFTNVPQVKILNVSNGALSSISPNGFSSTPRLEVVDLRGTPITDFPPDTLHGLSSLKLLYADNFKFCCQSSLPGHFNPKDCHAKTDDIASCKDLLRSDAFRVCLWVFAALSFAGNSGSFVARLYLSSKSGGGFNTFVTNLSIADFLMGVYLMIIGVADQAYNGEYLWHDTEWKTSTACNVAGFLSLLSSEVSAFTICLITLDRFLALRFPLSHLAFGKRSAIVACVIAWAVGVTLAAVPLLPVTSHWEFYSQTGICIPLPITPGNFKGHNYSFGVMVIFNFVLFLLIALGQVFIYWSVRMNSLLSANQTSKDVVIARRLSTIVLSDFLCWFPIGLLGLLASTGTPIPSEVNVGLAIFVLPFNSALNPFVYTFNVVMEKRKKAAEERLLKRWECRTEVSLQQSRVSNVKTGTTTRQAALEQIDEWIENEVVSSSELLIRYAPAEQTNENTKL
nr:hypothetical protein BaRGS_009369 [Batillaria attramentaria]